MRPWGDAQAVAFALAEAEHPTRPWGDRCLRLVVEASGYLEAAHPTAHEWWTWYTAQWPVARHGMPGSVVYWDTGWAWGGHAALMVNARSVVSTDVRGRGGLYLATIDEVSTWLEREPAGYPDRRFRAPRGHNRMRRWRRRP